MAPDPEDALELLSASFTHPTVRIYAVSRLEHSAAPEQILLYLPQLVQALKYESIKEMDRGNSAQVGFLVISRVEVFLG